MDAGDELVLDIHDGVSGLGQRGLEEAQQDGVALGRLEAPQTPGVVAVAPAGQEPARRWVNVGQRWPVGEAQVTDALQALEQPDEHSWRFTVRRHLEALQA